MNLSSFIARRIAFNREKTFSKFIINISLAAVALSVAVMILATTLVNGFQQAVSRKVFSFWGHIHITTFQPNASPLTEEIPFTASDSLEKAVAAIPGVKSVDRYATKSAILKTRNEIEGVIFKGVDRHYHRDHILQFLTAGRFIQFPDSGYSQDIIISDYLARELELKLNDPVIIYFIENAGELPRARKVTVSGIYKTSIEEYDKTYVIGDIALLQKLNGWTPEQTGGYEIFLKDYRQMEPISDEIYRHYLPEKLTTLTIRQIYPNIFDWLNLQNMNEIIIIMIMAIVAVINMITAMLILILERTNMTGILKSLGMRNWPLQKIFIYQSAYIVVMGVLLGNIFGLGLAFLQKSTGFFKLSEATYYMPVAPVYIKWWEVACIDLGTLLVCVLILVIPSFLIRKVTPVRAIGFK